MKVIIQKGQKTAIDLKGNIYSIEGLEIVKQASGIRIFYGLNDPYYKAVAAPNTTSTSYELPSDNIMLL